MKRKLFCLLTLLLCAVTGANATDAYVQWADMATSGNNANKAGTASTNLTPNVGVVTDLSANGTKEINSVTYYRYSGFDVSEDTSKYFEYSFSVADGYTFTPSKITVGWAPSGGKAIGFAVYAGTSSANLVKIGTLTHSSDNTYGTDEITSFTALGENTDFTLVRLVPYGKKSSIILNLVKIDGTLEVDGDTRSASTFGLTSEESVSLWKNQTSQITSENAAGAVTYESSNESVATVSSTGLIKAVGAGTATITVSDAGNSEVKPGVAYVSVIVSERQNTSTEYIAAGSNDIVMGSATVNEKLSGSSGLGTPVTYGDGPVLTLSSSANNFQSGSYTIGGNTVMKVGGGLYTLEVADGFNITSAVVYAMTNSNDNKGNLNTTSEGSNVDNVPTRSNMDKNAAASLDITDSKTFYLDGTSQFNIILEVTYSNPKHMQVTIRETGYATLFTDYAVTIPDGVKAYTATLNGAKDAITLKEVTTTIPASTAVILQADETPATATTFSFVAAEDVATISGNVLQGSLTDITSDVANNYYTLGLNEEDEVGMRLYTGSTIRAYSAYIPKGTVGARFLALNFDETTGVKAIDNEPLTMDNVYDLSGRKIVNGKSVNGKLQRGLYIVNGKKVVVK